MELGADVNALLDNERVGHNAEAIIKSSCSLFFELT